MQQTEKWKLNLIDKDDPFTPDALNENTKQLESVLSERLEAMGTSSVYAGSYEGTGAAGHEIELGFKPKLLILRGGGSGFSIITEDGGVYYSGGFYANSTELTDTGFLLGGHNAKGVTGWYVAFS